MSVLGDGYWDEMQRLRQSIKDKQQKVLELSVKQKQASKEYPESFTRSFKERIKKRDGYRCQFPSCGATEDLVVHHFYYSKSTRDEFVVVLCRVHNGVVNKRSEKNKWTDYFRNLMHYQLSRR